MVRPGVLTGALPLSRRTLFVLAGVGGAAAVLPAALAPGRVPAAAWTAAAWSGLVGRWLPIAQGGSVRLVEVVDRTSRTGVARFSLLLQPLGDRVGEGIHTVLHPQFGGVPLGTTSVGSSGRLLVVVDHATAQDQEHGHV